MLTVEKIFEIVADRGLKIVLQNGQPRLQGPKEEMTGALVAALRAHRLAVIAKVDPQKVEPPPQQKQEKPERRPQTWDDLPE